MSDKQKEEWMAELYMQSMLQEFIEYLEDERY